MFTICDYLTAYEQGKTTPSRAMENVYARIAKHDDPAMFITLRPLEDVKADALALERRGSKDLPLFGIPVAVKDNIDVAGLPTTAACPDFSYLAERDATAVAKLHAAGAIIIAKTNLDQFATGLVGVRSPYGTPRNTFRADIVPGGSSSGSGVAVAAGIVPIALGTDTAGSGRVPAALNNIVGLKPSLGAISMTGVVPACRTLDCMSIFALDVADAYTTLEIIAGFDETDAFSKAIKLTKPGAMPAGLRIGIPDAASRRFAGDAVAEAAFDQTIVDLEKLGAATKPIDLSVLFKTAALLYEGAWVAERYQAIRGFIKRSPASLHPVTMSIIKQANRLSAADAFAGFYRLAELNSEAAAIWNDIDVLLLPAFPRPRTLADLSADPIGPNSELGTYTNFVNLLDLCGLAVPGHFRSDGLPAGTTLVAPSGLDGLLASVGAAMHQQAGVLLGATGAALRPSEWTTLSTNDQVEIVVVGAHLSGLPLNGELTSRRASLARKITTTADYRLFALPGGPPFRPGLLRVEDGTGMPIEVEVWSMSRTAFGDFVGSIPAPLGIGTVRLADGTQPKGFLVEAEGARGARDITAFGGWRTYVSNGTTLPV